MLLQYSLTCSLSLSPQHDLQPFCCGSLHGFTLIAEFIQTLLSDVSLQVLVYTLVGWATKHGLIHWHTISYYEAKCTQHIDEDAGTRIKTFAPFSFVEICSCRGDTHATDGSRLNKDMVRLAALPSPPYVGVIYIIFTLYLHNYVCCMYVCMYACMYMYECT